MPILPCIKYFYFIFVKYMKHNFYDIIKTKNTNFTIEYKQTIPKDFKLYCIIENKVSKIDNSL